ncbi:hypothetical protein EVAR_8148_1 [Eumeta japonica]|uniref:Uncharacterized protein n=1 Tax=Eumeta variegata TaxID=151549 RepID=A0A4C1TSV9_EUMVA|nr:hypothetical protein EVAR_8148_1 [Eumeta japonica]
MIPFFPGPLEKKKRGVPLTIRSKLAAQHNGDGVERPRPAARGHFQESGTLKLTTHPGLLNEELEFINATVFLGITLDDTLQWGPLITIRHIRKFTRSLDHREWPVASLCVYAVENSKKRSRQRPRGGRRCRSLLRDKALTTLASDGENKYVDLTNTLIRFNGNNKAIGECALQNRRI